MKAFILIALALIVTIFAQLPHERRERERLIEFFCGEACPRHLPQ